MKTALIAACLLLSAPAFAHPGGHGGGYGGYGPAPTPRAETPAAKNVPDTYQGVVAALREQHAAANAALKNDKIASLHRACARMVELAEAAPGKALELGDEGRAKADAASTRIGAQAATLKTTATEGDKPAAKKALAALLADVEVLAGLTK